MYDAKKVAAQIRTKRLEKRYTQDYMAYKLNLSQNAYSKIELNYTRLTLEMLFRIADILEIDAIEIIRQDE